MQQEQAFRHHLRRAGKKPHVVDALVEHVHLFEDHLNAAGEASLDDIQTEALAAHAAQLSASERKKRMRTLGLYYHFTGDDDLADTAIAFRRGEVGKTRRPFKLARFQNVDPDVIARLEAAGVATVEDMLASGKTPADRAALASRTGVAPEMVLELVKLSDLARLFAVKGVRARLYYEAGLETPAQLAKQDPDELREELLAFVERTGFNGMAPLPRELDGTIANAKTLPQVVT